MQVRECSHEWIGRRQIELNNIDIVLKSPTFRNDVPMLHFIAQRI